MKFAKRLLMVAGAVAIAGVLSVALVPRAVHAVVATLVQIVPGTTTHVGQNEGQLVSLECGTYYTSYCNAVDSDGTLASAVYVVPSGYTLIVTDWEWSGNGGAAQGSYTFNSLRNVAGGDFALSGALVTTAGTSTYNHEHFATGIRIGSGVTMEDSLAAIGDGFSFVQGYLVPN
ncbi:MAG: hypothetical protein WA020_12110 [Candidatus Acidiferrales bacterium]